MESTAMILKELDKIRDAINDERLIDVEASCDPVFVGEQDGYMRYEQGDIVRVSFTYRIKRKVEDE